MNRGKWYKRGGKVEMNKTVSLLGIALVVIGVFVFFYASERNCIMALLTTGRLTPWTIVEIGGGILALLGFFIALFSAIKKSQK